MILRFIVVLGFVVILRLVITLGLIVIRRLVVALVLTLRLIVVVEFGLRYLVFSLGLVIIRGLVGIVRLCCRSLRRINTRCRAASPGSTASPGPTSASPGSTTGGITTRVGSAGAIASRARCIAFRIDSTQLALIGAFGLVHLVCPLLETGNQTMLSASEVADHLAQIVNLFVDGSLEKGTQEAEGTAGHLPLGGVRNGHTLVNR